jgi:uridine kinase
MKKPFVIAISSISGGGKSVVVKKLVEMMDDAVAIHFDDYETPDTYPKNPLDLLKNGIDFNVVKSPLLAQHLLALKNGEVVTTPRGEVLSPARYIVYEGALGYAQHETGQFIDFLAFIDTPLEVGLARRFSRSFATSHYDEKSREQLIRMIKELESFIDGYLLWTRIAYQALAEIVRPTSNLILEWNQSPEALALAIIEGLKEQNFH